MESFTDRTETHAFVNNNIQALPKDILIQLSIHLLLTIECVIGLTIGSTLQMLPLLLGLGLILARSGFGLGSSGSNFHKSTF